MDSKAPFMGNKEHGLWLPGGPASRREGGVPPPHSLSSSGTPCPFPACSGGMCHTHSGGIRSKRVLTSPPSASLSLCRNVGKQLGCDVISAS